MARLDSGGGGGEEPPDDGSGAESSAQRRQREEEEIRLQFEDGEIRQVEDQPQRNTGGLDPGDAAGRGGSGSARQPRQSESPMTRQENRSPSGTGALTSGGGETARQAPETPPEQPTGQGPTAGAVGVSEPQQTQRQGAAMAVGEFTTPAESPQTDAFEGLSQQPDESNRRDLGDDVIGEDVERTLDQTQQTIRRESTQAAQINQPELVGPAAGQLGGSMPQIPAREQVEGFTAGAIEVIPSTAVGLGSVGVEAVETGAFWAGVSEDAEGKTAAGRTGTVAEQGALAAATIPGATIQAAEQNPSRFAGGLVGGAVGGTAATRGLSRLGSRARSARVRRQADETVPFEDITSERGAEGDLPQFDTDRGAPTEQAVREVRERAGDNPDTVTDAAGTDRALFQSTEADLGPEFEARRGGSELPGLFTSPDASPLRLAEGRESSGLSLRLPRPSDFTGGDDRIATFPGDRIEGMPEDATGSGRVRVGRDEFEPDPETSGAQFLDEQAEQGTAFVRPTGSRTTELEGIFPPGSRFEQTEQLAVEMPSGRAVPMDVFRRGEGGDVDAPTGGTRTAGEIASDFSRSGRADGDPVAPFGGTSTNTPTGTPTATTPTGTPSETGGLPGFGSTGTGTGSGSGSGIFGMPVSGPASSGGSETTPTGTTSGGGSGSGSSSGGSGGGPSSTPSGGGSDPTSGTPSGTPPTGPPSSTPPTGPGSSTPFGLPPSRPPGGGSSGGGGSSLPGMTSGPGSPNRPRSRDDDDDDRDDNQFGNIAPAGTGFVNPVAGGFDFLLGRSPESEGDRDDVMGLFRG